MPVIKSTTDIAKKWSEVTPMRSPQYRLGVETTTKDWAGLTKAAEDTWKSAITAAAAAGRFGKGVTAAGTAHWRKRTSEIGPDRWSSGVMVAAPEYAKGFAPYRDIIERITLSPRFAKGDLRNYKRVQEIGIPLHDAKVKAA